MCQVVAQGACHCSHGGSLERTEETKASLIQPACFILARIKSSARSTRDLRRVDDCPFLLVGNVLARGHHDCGGDRYQSITNVTKGRG